MRIQHLLETREEEKKSQQHGYKANMMPVAVGSPVQPYVGKLLHSGGWYAAFIKSKGKVGRGMSLPGWQRGRCCILECTGHYSGVWNKL